MTALIRTGLWLDTTLFAMALVLAIGSGSLAGATLARTQATIDQAILCHGWAVCIDDCGAVSP